MAPSRRLADYLDDLFGEAEQAAFAAIVVGFEGETRFVWSTGDSAGARLQALLEAGGKPIAILGADIVGNALIYRLNPFPEYENDTGARAYLAAVGEEVADILEHRVAAARN